MTFVLVCIINLIIGGKWLVQGQATCDYSSVDPQCSDDMDIDFCQEISGMNSYNAQPCQNQFLVALQEDRIGEEGCFFHACGGTLIAPNLVATAAHCIYPKIENGSLTGQSLTPNLYAAHAPACRHFQGYGRYKVTQYWIYPKYDDATLANDIAILELNSTVDVATITKFDSTTIQKELYNADLNIVGWGATNATEQVQSNYNVTPLKGALEMKLVPREQCIEKLQNVGEFSIIYQGMMCAQKFAADACSGDSGGPLIYKKTDQDIYLVGVVSWGARGSQCFTSANVTLPGVYTNVTYYKEWIEEIVQQVNPLADVKISDPPMDSAGLFSDIVDPPLSQDKILPVLSQDSAQGNGEFNPNFKINTTVVGEPPSSPTYEPIPVPTLQLPPAAEDTPSLDCSLSLNGCVCLDQCYNNFDGNGFVCSVDPDECVPQNYNYEESIILFVIEVAYGYVDQCKPGCTGNQIIDTKTSEVQRTIQGCECMTKCSNPDNDPNGNWCQVNPNSCPQYTFNNDNYQQLGFLDYCIQKYRGNSSIVSNCNGGCLCVPKYDEWGNMLDDFCEEPSLLGNILGYEPFCDVINAWECGQAQLTSCQSTC